VGRVIRVLPEGLVQVKMPVNGGEGTVVIHATV
jgi:hypothetical protein